MTAGQALQLLHLHHKTVRLGWREPHLRRRKGESEAVFAERLGAVWRGGKALDAEDEALRRALRYEKSGDWRFEGEAPPLPLPPLHLVTGWSKADPAKKPHHPDVALFGGWRIGDLEKRRREMGEG